jgi:hypothetical protein
MGTPNFKETAVALPARDHRISLTDAAALTKRHRDAKVGAEKSGAFHKDQVLELLNQAGCVGLRIYYGRQPDGKPALVLTGIDKGDKDLTGGTILEMHIPCPPFCGDANALNT